MCVFLFSCACHFAGLVEQDAGVHAGTSCEAVSAARRNELQFSYVFHERNDVLDKIYEVHIKFYVDRNNVLITN